MKAANHEYYDLSVVDGVYKLVQITYQPKTEMMYINLVRFYDKEGWDIPPTLEARANIALNRLLQHEAQNAVSNRK